MGATNCTCRSFGAVLCGLALIKCRDNAHMSTGRPQKFADNRNGPWETQQVPKGMDDLALQLVFGFLDGFSLCTAAAVCILP
jgi:hypothetical protein